MKTVYINSSAGGIVNDPRTRGNVVRRLLNFDAITNPLKLTPYHDSESGDSSATTRMIKNFCIAPYIGTYKLMGLGQNSSNHTEVYSKDLSSGGSGDLGDASWGTMTNNASSNTFTDYNVFVYYATEGKVYGLRGGSEVWSFTPDGSTAWNDSEQALSYTNCAQGLVHSKDDILYIPYDNKIASNNAGTWATAVLTLPKRYVITSICEYGNYLAIACKALSGVEDSVVYLWDRDSSLSTISEVIDWGQGNIAWIQQLDGNLIGCSVIPAVNSSFNSQIIFRQYTGSGGAEKMLVLEGASNTGTVQPFTQLVNQRIYFMMGLTINGTYSAVVWSLGVLSRQVGSTSLPSYFLMNQYSLVQERTTNNDTAFASSDVLYNFFQVDHVLFQTFSASNTVTTTKTNDQSSFTATAILESVINPGINDEDLITKKQLIGCGVTVQPLTSGQQVVLKYRVDGGSWITVITDTTVGDVVTENQQDATPSNFTAGREYEFRIESTGGAVVTGFWYGYDVLQTLI